MLTHAAEETGAGSLDGYLTRFGPDRRASRATAHEPEPHNWLREGKALSKRHIGIVQIVVIRLRKRLE